MSNDDKTCYETAPRSSTATEYIEQHDRGDGRWRTEARAAR